MRYGVIDIGSNTIRLNIYKVEKGKVALLLSRKNMAGLASFIKKQEMNQKGIDRAVEARDGNIVIAALDGELTVKRLRMSKGRLLLVPENPDFSPTEIHPEMAFEVWGVVTYIIHKA